MEEYIGMIKLFAGEYAPKGWLICNGSLLPIQYNQTLFAVIGTRYGGDGKINFALPDLRSRIPVGAAAVGPPTSLPTVNLADKGGAFSAPLTSANLPSFSVPVTGQVGLTGAITAKIKVNSSPSIEPDPTGHYIAQNDSSTGSFSTVATPGSYLNDTAAEVSHTLAVTTVGLQANYSGAATPISTMPPYLSLNYIICVEGLYPSRP